MIRSRSLVLLSWFALVPSLANAQTPPVPPASGKAPAASQPSAAPPSPTMLEARQHFQAGIAAYNEGRYEDAISELKQAYLLSHIPVLLFNIADTYEKIGQPDKALHYYERYLAEAKPDERQVVTAKARVEVLSKTAASQPAAVSRGPATPAVPVAPSAGAPKEFHHEIIDAAPPGLPLDIHAEVPAQAKTITLFYRAPGQEAFTQVPMKPRYREWVGRIPASVMTGTSVQYYVEAKDADGSTIGHSGKASSPNIVYVDPSAPAQYFADLGGGVVAKAPAAAQPSEQVAAVVESAPEATARRERLYRGTLVGTAAGAAVALTAGIVFNRMAAYEAAQFEKQAVTSSSGPTQQYGPSLQAYQDNGHAFQTASYVSFGVGAGLIVASAASYYLWTHPSFFATREEAEPASAAPAPEAPSGEPSGAPGEAPDDMPPAHPEAASANRFFASPFATSGGFGVVGVGTF